MLIDSVSSLKTFLKNGDKKICILDNNLVEILTRIEKDIPPDLIFNQYDLIIIPEWVYFEIQDSNLRSS